MAAQLDTNHVRFEEAFANPASLYRGAPFWSWNGKLDRDELLRQLGVFREMGIGGVTIHCRTGLDTEYLGDVFMDLVKICRDHARDQGMLTWLYDEDRWPSGAAGGLVTQDHQFRQRYLLFTCTPYGAGATGASGDSMASGSRAENGELLASYAVTLEDDKLTRYRVLQEGDEAGTDETAWHAYLETARPTAWFNHQTYVDTLNPQAMRRFIQVTHERYKQAVGDSFGTHVPAIFTDEPQFTHKRFLPFAKSKRDAFFPWTGDLDEAFAAQFGESILAHLPEVVWDLPDRRPSVWRYRYHEWVAERFASSFADQLGDWCNANRLALTGHMMEESTLAKQTKALGEAMRSYRAMRIPGIDMLCDWEELNTAKQAQSAARQFGCPGTMSELYGVTGWDFPFHGHKRQGDWQAALGVLFRVHHLSWYCMRGEAKRDYPASISYQSPWYKQYGTIEDHFARLGATLSRGKADCKVAVIHPIESYWLCAGPADTSGAECAQRDDQFEQLTGWLLHGLVDFDFVAESLLPDQEDSGDAATFGVGQMRYEVVIVPGMRTIRSTTLDRLEAFADGGGHVVFAGEVPTLVDAVESDRAQRLASRCECVPLGRAAVLDAVNPHRDIDIITPWGRRPDSLLYQMRIEGDDRYLFICNMGHVQAAVGSLRIRGRYQVASLDTSTGDMTPVAASYEGDQTHVELKLHVADHVLLRLTPGEQHEGDTLVPRLGQELARVTSPVSVTLDEPNVLLFDKAQLQINDGSWHDEQQLLDIENVVRGELGLPEMTGHIAQPWTDPTPPTKLATVRLRATFISRVVVHDAQLALENIEESRVCFNGQPVDMTATGYFTDHAIATVAMPGFGVGEHTIEIELDYTKRTAIEWFYLLGDFGVTIDGVHGVVDPPVRSLSFGDWTVQGLPFYGGNVTYHCTAPVDGSAIQLPQIDGAAARVTANDQSCMVYRAPFTADLSFKAGQPVDITLYGHRANCFGSVHLAEPLRWQGPNAYRVTGSQFSPEFQLKALGIRTSPIVYE